MTPGAFIGTLFQSRDAMHLEHLKTTSFAEHKALGGYYDGIVDLADKFAEVYFGRFKRVEIVVPEARAESSVEHMKKMQQIIDADRNMYPSELQNIMDEMLALVNKTLYLLTLV